MDLVSRPRQLTPRVIDILVAAVVAVPTAMDAWWNEPGTRQADAGTYALVLVSILALLFRRRWPVPVAGSCGVALSGLYVLGHHGELLNLPVMVALYTVAVQCDRRATIATAVVASAWSGILGFTSDDPIGARGGAPVLEMIWPLVPLALGEGVRSRRELLGYAEAERERAAQRRVLDERARMAREFHDVVAHTMAGVNVQMAAAVAAFDADPETARRALHEARTATKAALQELRATVALLRQSQDMTPAPRLDALAKLAHTTRATGVTVSVDDDRAGLELSAAAELAAYRIVQEALTNVARHSHARHAAVSLRRGGWPWRSSTTATLPSTAAPQHRVVAASASSAWPNGPAPSVAASNTGPGGRAGSGWRRPAHLERVVMTTRVALADDQTVVRAGFRVLLELTHDLAVVGEATNGRQAVDLARRTRPDVVLMDIRMPEMDGIEATRIIARDPHLARTKMIVLTTFEIDDYVFGALRAGASGSCSRTSTPTISTPPSAPSPPATAFSPPS